MTSISSTDTVNTAAVAASSNTKTSQLSDSTKRTLEAMGITATDDMTESQAKAKIAEAQAENNAGGAGAGQENSEQEILADAKTLAAAIGVPVSLSDDLSEILDNIGEKIEQMINESEGNPAVLSKLNSYYRELVNLDDEYESLSSLQSGIFGAMEQTATSNKLALGL